MAYVARFMIPFKKLDFLLDYFETIRLIEVNRRGGLLSCEERDQLETINHRLELANLASIAKCLHLVYLWVYPLSDHNSALLNVDVVTMAGLQCHFQLCLLSFIALIHFLYARKLFVHFHPYFLQLYYAKILCNSYHDIFLKPYRYRGRPILVYVKTMLFYVLNSLQSFLILIHAIVLHIQVQGLTLVWFRWTELESNRLFYRLQITVTTLAQFELSLALFCFFAYYLAFVGMLLLGTVAIGMIIVFIMFAQIRHRCDQLRRCHYDLVRRLLTMLRHNRRSVILVLNIADYYSVQFGAWMLLNMPLNGYLLAMLIFANPNPTWIPMILLFMFQQWMVIFGLHLLAIRLNDSMTRPNSSLLYLVARRRFPVRTNLTLGHYLEAFHNPKPYGIGYGKFGIISMLSFVKFLLFYTEFVMFSYKIVTWNIIRR